MASEDLKFIVSLMRRALNNAPVKESELSGLGDDLFNDLIKNEYINEKGFVTDKFYKLTNYFDLKINTVYEDKKIFISQILKTHHEMVPQGMSIDLKEDELLCLLEAMDESERQLFCDAFSKFFLYMKIASRCRGTADVKDIWTNFILIILFGLIEKIMVNENILLDQYLERNVSRCVSPDETRKLLEEWRETYGANRKVHKFFKNHILENERTEIIDVLKGNPYFKKITSNEDPIKKFVNEIISWRSKFVHELGLGSASASDNMTYIEPDKNGDLSSDNEMLYPAVSIDLLIYYVLLGFFRRFNKNSILTTIGN